MPSSPLSRRHALVAVAAASLSLVAGRARAQTPLRILVGSSAGSVPDVVARRIAERLSAGGLNALVDNKVGAAGRLAIAELRSAAADGQTLLLAPGAIATMYPAIYSKLGYDARADLAPVSTAAELSLALAVGPAVPASVNRLPAFIDWCRGSGSVVSFGSPGVGTPPHVLGTLLASRTGISWTHVPYTGGPPVITDLIGGRLSATVLPEGLLRPHAAQGTLRLLATSGSERSDFTPQVPSFAEQGYPDLVLREWFGFFAAAATPPERLRSLAREIRQACAHPAVETAFSAMAIRALAGEPMQMAERVAREAALWEPVIRSARISVES